MRVTALLYEDNGAGPFVTTCLERALVDAGYAVRRCKADELLDDSWHALTSLLALPGGADRPYAEKLDGLGNASIRRFVEKGGRFLGVCAGAYYACRRIDFAGQDLRVEAPRELGLFPGTAVGSLCELAQPYRTNDLDCSAAVRLTSEIGDVRVLYWGGCRFVADDDANGIEVLARYGDLPHGRDIAAVRCSVGDGEAVLVGTHVEVRGDEFDRERHAYPDGNADRFTRQADVLRQHESARRALWKHLLRL